MNDISSIMEVEIVQRKKITGEINGRVLVDVINDLFVLPKDIFEMLVVMIHALAERERERQSQGEVSV